MRIFNIGTNTHLRHPLPICACIGYFDGMHKGHQELIKRTVELSEKYNCESTLITFDPDPWITIKGLDSVEHITPVRQRMNLAVYFGIENFVILNFNEEMSRMPHAEFCEKILGQLDLKGLVCGFDFRYGYQGEGNAETLKEEAGCEVIVVDAVEDEKGKISSSRIASELKAGNMEEVNAMLGYPYFIEGTVIEGNHKGTGIGFPTANVKYSAEYLLPRTGVYAGFATVAGRQYKAMINLGHNPTFNYSERLSLEVHLLGFKGDIYGKYMRVYPLYYVRDEMRFNSKENLCMQLYQDRRTVRSLLKEYE